jgi:hypothetical protein
MRMMPMPPGPGGVAIAAMVSSALPAGGICSGVLNESIVLAICYLLLLLLFCFRAGPFLPLLPGR